MVPEVMRPETVEELATLFREAREAVGDDPGRQLWWLRLGADGLDRCLAPRHGADLRSIAINILKSGKN
jgi:hypothetical protein